MSGTPSAIPGRYSVDAAVKPLLEASMSRGEQIASVLRIGLCSLSGARSALLWSQAGWPVNEQRAAAVTFPALALGIAFSAYALVTLRRPRSPLRLVHASVTVDAVVAFAGLLTNVLWPWPGYLGIINMPDIGLLVLLALGAGLRQAPSASVLGGVLFGSAFLALALLDQRNPIPRSTSDMHHYAFHAIFLVISATMAFVYALRTRTMAERAARAAVQLAFAGKSLASLLHEHHDLRAWLASARLNADLVQRAMEEAGSRSAPAVEAVERLRDDLAKVHAVVDDIKARAFGESMGLEKVSPVAVQPVVEEVMAGLRPRFPGSALQAQVADDLMVGVAGGAASLQRVLFGLLVNACEGDGERRAGQIGVRACRQAANRVRIEVRDDGPGFPAQMLDESLVRGRTSKKEGSGLGLSLAARLVEASGGQLSWANGSEGGARVVVDLPAA